MTTVCVMQNSTTSSQCRGAPEGILARVSAEAIDQKTGTVNVYKLLPEPGDSLMIVNCGTHYEVRYHHWREPPLTLTDEDIEAMKSGRLTFN